MHIELGYNMSFKAIFFDRDGTLTYNNPEKTQWRNEAIKSWSGHDFDLSYDKMCRLFELTAEGKNPWYRNVDDERVFFQKYYQQLLIGEGIRENVEGRARLLFDELWCNHERLLFPEVTGVLDYFLRKGYRMGVISDTSPSLELTLSQLGLAKYFTSYTASSLVGAGKPSPIIFNAALAAQNVSAKESLYVDDYDVEADGAREQGFTSFNLDRNGHKQGKWYIRDLKEIVDYVETFGRDD
jgi:putative hydrolase of the HAD superfamily